MKKILSFIAILLVGLVLVACEPTVKEDGAQAKLDTAHAGMDILISDPSNITANFVVPSMLAGGIEAVWTSDNPGVISFGDAVNNEVTATVNRPAKGQGDATVKITATLKLKSELSDEILEKKWEKTLTVKENTVEEIEINTIADILAIRDETYDGGEYTVTIPNVTIFAKGDVFFGYDGTAIIQLFNSQTTFEVGKVYDVTGALEWYFGIWELVKSTGVEKTSATPQYPNKETVNSVDSKISELTTAGEHNYPAVADGNFEPIYATVKGNIFMIEGDSGNYNTYIIDAAKDALVLGEPDTPASGFMFYYGTADFPYVRSFAGFEVEMDVVIYTYRSNNLAFAVYYVGGEEGITANLNEEQKVDVAKSALKLPVEVYKENQTLTLANKSDEVNIAWSFKDSEDANNALIKLADGKVTLPASGQKDVKLVATLTLGEVSTTKEFTIRVGEVAPSTIAEVLAATNNTYKFMITGTVLGYNAHRQISVADETGAITVYASVDDAADLALLVGKQVEVIGTRTVFSGLIQLGSPEVTDLELDGTLPVATDLRTITLWDAESLLPFQSNLVSVSNLKVKEVIANDYGNVELILEDEVTLKTIRFYWDSRQPLVGSSDFIKGLKVGDYVSFTDALLTWRSNNGAIGIHAATQVAVGESPVLTDADELALDKQLLELPASTLESLELPATLANGTTVVWTSSHPEVLGNDGTYTKPAADTVVTLTAALTNGEATDTKVFEITVKAEAAVETVAYTFDFGIVQKTGYGAGNLVFSNTNGDSFTLDKNRVQIYTNTFAPWIDSAAYLVMAPISGATHSYIQFDLTAAAYANASKIEFDFAVSNQNNHDQTVALAGSSVRVEKLEGENWVTVGDDVFSQLTKDALTTVSINLTGAGTYRLVYEAPAATSTTNTAYAIGVDNLKIYVIN
ncbi:hypothetical protein IY230_04195 [Acholeplasma laidlawii]|uniref:immunoglobulin-like domain-containing protein n=1 Tax=Acholeplasma laidlawii TaxID=2148 RepID=UPI0018C2357B|nr:immunoglobulin-like domain-containing protein [Acholeplasma laidlawii]MBG0762809.1 hypothetical protein [Acholeplasma laidlawii]